MTQIVLDRIAEGRSRDAASAPVSRGRGDPLPRSVDPKPHAAAATCARLRTRSRPDPPARGRMFAATHRSGDGGASTGVLAAGPEVSAAPLTSLSSAPTWQLTDRGVAVLLVVGLMIMVAALTVVGLTAVKVTGAGYQATSVGQHAAVTAHER